MDGKNPRGYGAVGNPTNSGRVWRTESVCNLIGLSLRAHKQMPRRRFGQGLSWTPKPDPS